MKFRIFCTVRSSCGVELEIEAEDEKSARRRAYREAGNEADFRDFDVDIEEVEWLDRELTEAEIALEERIAALNAGQLELPL